jgi:Fe(3+) dicitrate transport protein
MFLRMSLNIGAVRQALALAAIPLVLAGTALAAGQQPSSGVLAGRVTDESGAVIPHAELTVEGGGAPARSLTADAAGRFEVTGLPPGPAVVSADAPGFAARRVMAIVKPGERVLVTVTLQIGTMTESLQVVPERVVTGAEAARRIPGSIDVLDLALLENTRYVTTADVLRKAPGVHVREEEGFGLRPNISVRGLNPTRSARILLLEDGIPLTYAPYGDNAAYYHPPIERFERVELLKGSGQIAHGPMTVGGVINYVTPPPPGKAAGSLTTSAGNRGYVNAHGGWGTTAGRTGFQVDFLRKQGDGARENISTHVHDFTAKVVSRLANHHVLTLRGSYFDEDSNITYSGLRDDEYRANPRQNPFRNDFFYIDRYGASATHTYTLSPKVAATTSVYMSNFRRHWWRQSSNSGQRPNRAADAACGGMANLDTTCGIEGRLRHYVTWGVEPRLRAVGQIGGISTDTEVGVRAHFEDQQRRQENGTAPTARSGVLVENNERLNHAYAGFVQNRFTRGSLSVTPGLRLEHVTYERSNRLLEVTGRTALTEVIPGIGAAYSPHARQTVFAGVHRGFTPPRTEDIIDNATGGAIDLDPERSWNYEVGVRTGPWYGVSADAAFFRMDYSNQIVPATLAGGVGSLLTNGGETLHQGIEMSLRSDSAARTGSRHNVYTRTAYTWLPVARFAGTRVSSVPGFSTTQVTGNRLPYAPHHLLTAGGGFTHARGWDVNAEVVVISEQFADDLNTVAGTADGQRGLLPGYPIVNATANYPLTRSTLFVAVRNVLDRTEIVDRSRGILPTAPRTVHVGLKLRF